MLFQLCFPGIPSVFYGDELGASGLVEADYRRPMPWQGGNEKLLAFYRRAIALRRELAPLSREISAAFRRSAAAGSSPFPGNTAASGCSWP